VRWRIGDPFCGYMLLGPPSRNPRDCNDFPKSFKQKKATHTHWDHNDCPILVKSHKVTHTLPLPKKERKRLRPAPRPWPPGSLLSPLTCLVCSFAAQRALELERAAAFYPFFRGVSMKRSGHSKQAVWRHEPTTKLVHDCIHSTDSALRALHLPLCLALRNLHKFLPISQRCGELDNWSQATMPAAGGSLLCLLFYDTLSHHAYVFL